MAFNTLYTLREFFMTLSNNKPQLTANQIRDNSLLIYPPEEVASIEDIETGVNLTYSRKYMIEQDFTDKITRYNTANEMSIFLKSIYLTNDQIIELLNKFLNRGFTESSLEKLIGEPLTYESFSEYVIRVVSKLPV